MGYVGDIFTWRRGRIRERLDRGLINDAWADLFPNANLEHQNFNHSDHRPLLVDTDYFVGVNPNQQGPKRFEARWLREDLFPELVQETWDKLGTDPNVSGIFEKSRVCTQLFTTGIKGCSKNQRKGFEKHTGTRGSNGGSDDE